MRLSVSFVFAALVSTGRRRQSRGVQAISFKSTSSRSSRCPHVSTLSSSSPINSDQHVDQRLDRRNLLEYFTLLFLSPIVVGSLPAAALTPSEASQAYNSYAFDYDELDGGSAADILGIQQARLELVAKAKGHVLEIGAGTGLNLPSYDFSQIQSLTLLDVSPGMLAQAESRWNKVVMPRSDDLMPPVKFVQGDATSELVQRFGVDTFDTVVDSFSLCVMGTDGARECLDQMTQVVKPGTGRILLLENSRATNPLVGAYQDATASVAAMAGGKGCVYNQNVRGMLTQTGSLEILDEQAYAGGLFRAFECRVV